MTKPASNSNHESPARKIGMGELDVLHGTGTLRTLLGSCIGLVLHDSNCRVGGVAHIVLPTSIGSGQPPGKYADTALPELIRLIEQSGGKSKHLAAKLVGGARMFSSTNMNSIGDQNLATVERLLQNAGIPVLARHCGGNQGRRLAYDVQTGAVTVEIVGEPPVVL